MSRPVRQARRWAAVNLRQLLRKRGYALMRVDEDSLHYVQRVDDRRPLPSGAAERLRPDAARLLELRAAYREVDPAVTTHSQWRPERVSEVDLRYFRGDSPILWQYLEQPRITRLKYFAYLRYLEDRDHVGLLDRLTEDGSFGCWTFSFPGRPMVSRDLLDSINELLFLDRELDVLTHPELRVLDVGAGYGRLAHRLAAAAAGLADHCCVDAVPESTFLCEYHLEFRGCCPPARVVALHELDDTLVPGGFDLALNVHSWSECPRSAVAWWAERLATLEVPTLLLVPNEPTELLTTEADGSKLDFAPVLEDAGYELDVREPVIADPAVRELVGIEDHFHLFRRRP